MSTMHRIHQKPNDTGRCDRFESMTLGEQLFGKFVVILVLLTAILLRSL